MRVWLRRAIADRDAQLDYIAQDNPRAAIDQGDRIVHQVGQLIEHPEMGRVGRKQDTRELWSSAAPHSSWSIGSRASASSCCACCTAHSDGRDAKASHQ